MARFHSEEVAIGYLENLRWSNGPVCPHCQNSDAQKIWKMKSGRLGLRQCVACSKQFRVTVGTIFERSHIPLHLWLIAWFLMSSSKKGISAKQMQRTLGLGSYQSAWFLCHRIRSAMQDGVFKEKLKGIVECDETYVGGKNHKRGRDTSTKTPVMGIVERHGRAVTKVVEKVNGKTLKGEILRTVEPEARVMTDEWPSYRGLDKHFSTHETVNHGAGEYQRGDVTTNSVESFFSLIKRSVMGAFHHITRKYMQFYCDEICFRWDRRKITDGARMREGLLLCFKPPLTLQQLQKAA